jgi:hypothetical protein
MFKNIYVSKDFCVSETERLTAIFRIIETSKPIKIAPLLGIVATSFSTRRYSRALK